MGEGLTMTNLLDSQPTGPAAPLPPPGAMAPAPEPRRTPAGVRVLWKLFAGLFVLGALLWAPYQVVTLLAHEEREENESFPAAGLTTLEVDGSAGSVTIVTAETDTVDVRADISEGLRKTGESRQVVDGTLELHSTCPNIGSDWCRVDYEVTMPRDLAVVVRNGNGHVSVTGTDGTVTIDNDNGSVELDDLTGAVRASTDNGRVEATRLRSQAVDASADNGRVTLTFVAPPTSVVASSDNGRIDITVPDDGTAYRVTTETDNGHSDVKVPRDDASEHTITARTDNGGIAILTN